MKVTMMMMLMMVDDEDQDDNDDEDDNDDNDDDDDDDVMVEDEDDYDNDDDIIMLIVFVKCNIQISNTINIIIACTGRPVYAVNADVNVSDEHVSYLDLDNYACICND